MCENLFYGEYSHFLSHTELDAYQTLRGSSTNKKHVTHDQEEWNLFSIIEIGKGGKVRERARRVCRFECGSSVCSYKKFTFLFSSSSSSFESPFFPSWEFFRLIFTRQTFDWRVVLYTGMRVVGGESQEIEPFFHPHRRRLFFSFLLSFKQQQH